MSSLEQKLKQIFIDQGVHSKTLLLALSGGRDSMFLLHFLNQLKSDLSLKLYATYVHHGKENTLQGQYRDSAWEKVKEETQNRNLKCFLHLCSRQSDSLFSSCLSQNKNDFNLNESSFFSQGLAPNEASYRKARYLALHEKKRELKADYIVLAHFLDDLLETRLIRLIRGTGRGGLKAMSVREGVLLRPFLGFQREEFLNHPDAKKLSFVDDPSNQNLSLLRNWIRIKALPELEKKRQGSIQSFARSLENLCDKEEEVLDFSQIFIEKEALSFPLFMELDQEKKVALLFYYMRKMHMKNYTLNHVKEVLKHLQVPRKKIQFQLLKHHWEINEKKIKAYRREK